METPPPLDHLPSRRARRQQQVLEELVQVQPPREAAQPATSMTRLAEKWLSALVVTVFSTVIGMNAAWANSLWISVVVIFAAGVILAIGWERLIGSRVPLMSQIFISMATFVAAVALAFIHDQAAIFFAFGVLLVAMVGVSMWTAPAPRDHSSVFASDEAELTAQQLARVRRNSWVMSSASASLATSITALTIAVGGTAWIAMSATDSWRLLLPIAAAIVAAVVIGDQIGSSWLGQALWALAAGVFTGAVGSVLMLSLGHGKTLGHLVLPSVASLLGPQGTVIALGVGTGVVVAIAVMVIDAVFGDHHSDTDLLAAGSRGAAKFLMCGLVIYMVVRVAGS